MFQFTAFPSGILSFSYTGDWAFPNRVSPFGYPRVDGCLRLTAAFRSLPRPSSAPGAEAFSLCSSSLLALFFFSCLYSVFKVRMMLRLITSLSIEGFIDGIGLMLCFDGYLATLVIHRGVSFDGIGLMLRIRPPIPRAAACMPPCPVLVCDALVTHTTMVSIRDVLVSHFGNLTWRRRDSNS